MPPKRAKKVALSEFLGESGSWADEMDNLPNAPAMRTDEERSNDRYGRRDDFLSTRPDRGSAPQRDDLPLPTQPPYTAFIGNLAFDLTESELEEFFGSPKTKSIKIIKDREDKPKGFGYIEFVELEGLKDALAKSGSNFSGRTIRVSVAEPPKGGFGGGFEDEAKFDSPWRRDGPLPDTSREPSRRRFDGPPSGDRALPSVTEGLSDWRASGRPARTEPDVPAPSFRRKGSGFGAPSEGQPSAADTEETWTIGGKFKPAPTIEESKFGSVRGRGDMGPPREPVSTIPDEIDWRAAARPRTVAKEGGSPTGSTAPTPNRRKLELLPRSGSASVSPSPLSSPKLAHSPAAVTPAAAPRSSPFGAAKPVDVTSKELEVMERIEKERLALPMSRTSSLRGTERTPITRARSPPPPSAPVSKPSTAPTVRPTLSFASAAKKDAAALENAQSNKSEEAPVAVAEVTEKLAGTDI